LYVRQAAGLSLTWWGPIVFQAVNPEIRRQASGLSDNSALLWLLSQSYVIRFSSDHTNCCWFFRIPCARSSFGAWDPRNYHLSFISRHSLLGARLFSGNQLRIDSFILAFGATIVRRQRGEDTDLYTPANFLRQIQPAIERSP
jgi:hypothetical protein